MIFLAIDWLNLWSGSWPAGLAMLILGLGFAIILLIASEKLKVQVDERVDQVLASLPNANCGACGFAGCSQYAKAIVEDPSLLGKCAPGGPACLASISMILNLGATGPLAPRRAIVHCRAHAEDKTFNGQYYAVTTCTAANALPSVQACAFGCLGFGDCFGSCRFDAIEIIDGLAVVNYEKCTGCGACVQACPRQIIALAPMVQDNVYTVACSSKENGKTTKANCAVGCIGCGLCTKQSPLFTMKDNLAKMDYDKFTPSPEIEAAFEKCPTAVIIEVGLSPRPNKTIQNKPSAVTAS